MYNAINKKKLKREHLPDKKTNPKIYRYKNLTRKYILLTSYHLSKVHDSKKSYLNIYFC